MIHLAIGVAWRDRASLWPAFRRHIAACAPVFSAAGVKPWWIIRGNLGRCVRPLREEIALHDVEVDESGDLETWAVRRDILASPSVAGCDYFVWHDSDDWHDPYAISDACIALETLTHPYAFHAHVLRAWGSGVEVEDELVNVGNGRGAPMPSNCVLRGEDVRAVPYIPTVSGRGDRSRPWCREMYEHASKRLGSSDPLGLPGIRAVYFSHSQNTSAGNKAADMGRPDFPGTFLPAASFELAHACMALE